MLDMRGNKGPWSAALILLALTGCGGEADERKLNSAPSEVVTVPGGEKGPAPVPEEKKPPPGLTKAAYIDQADIICAAAQPKIDALENGAQIAAKEGDFDGAADQFEQGLSESDREIAALRDLPVLEGSEATLSRIYDGVEEANQVFRGALDKLRSGDVAGFNSIGDQARLASNRSKRIAIAFGFEVCGRSG